MTRISRLSVAFASSSCLRSNSSLCSKLLWIGTSECGKPDECGKSDSTVGATKHFKAALQRGYESLGGLRYDLRTSQRLPRRMMRWLRSAENHAPRSTSLLQGGPAARISRVRSLSSISKPRIFCMLDQLTAFPRSTSAVYKVQKAILYEASYSPQRS